MIRLQDLVSQFTGRIEKENAEYPYTILVFDSYDSSLSVLKHQTWASRHKQQVQYKLTSNTVVKDIMKLNDLLSHRANKQNITMYFAEACML